jgi:putative transposase
MNQWFEGNPFVLFKELPSVVQDLRSMTPVMHGGCLQLAGSRRKEWWMARNRIRRDRFDEEKITSIIKQLTAGRTVTELSRELGVSRATLYVWKAKYQSSCSDQSFRISALEEENWRLKQMVGELYLERERLLKNEKKRLGGR